MSQSPPQLLAFYFEGNKATEFTAPGEKWHSPPSTSLQEGGSAASALTLLWAHQGKLSAMGTPLFRRKGSHC